MQRSQSWANWDLNKRYTQRHIYETEPAQPPSYDDDGPPFYVNKDDVPSANPELLCSRCMLAILKIYSNKAGTGAFGLFLPPAQTCILCRLLGEIQKSSTLEVEKYRLGLLGKRIVFPTLSRAPPAHMKDIIALWNDTRMQDRNCRARVVARQIDINGIRAISRHQVDPAVVRSWLVNCEEEHGKRCPGVPIRDVQTSRHIYLIDVRHFCLVRKSVPCRYVALSYVWGKVSTFRLREADIAPLSDFDGLREIEDRLPRTIMDAIEFVRSIEETFLWVDAICIPQDNPKELEEQIGHMASIYRIAVCTLVAISNADAADPLPGVHAGTRNVRSFFETAEVTLAERQPSIVPVLLNSTYHTRCWTFQERLLSARCIYFTPEQVFMQCQAGIYREDRVACTLFENLGRDPQVLMPLSPALIEASSPSGLSDNTKNFILFRQIIEEFTTKSLSFEADILHAFTGVAEELGAMIQTPMIAGMPERLLIRAMLFQSKKPSFSKRTVAMLHLDVNTKELQSLNFPSWSWCGWVGPIEYKNVGSIISHISRGEVCTASKSAKLPAVFRPLAETVEPQSPGTNSDRERTTYPKFFAELQPFTLRFMASADTTGAKFKLEHSSRGVNYLSILTKSGLTCGLIRVDDPYANSPSHSQHGQEKTLGRPKPQHKETHSEGLILLCDIEQDLIKQPEEVDHTWQRQQQQRRVWSAKLYYDGNPWRLCAVMYVRWRGGIAERLGLGEIAKDDWVRANPSVQAVHLR